MLNTIIESSLRNRFLVIVGTLVCALITKLLVGLRVSEEVEMSGLDLPEHGEEGYHS